MPLDSEAFADRVVLNVKAVLAPVLADVKSLQTQIAGWESRWNDLGTLRERVAVVEAKELPSVPEPVAPVDLNPIFQRLAVAEHKLAALPATEQALGAMRDRMVAVEAKAAAEPRHEPVVQQSEPLTPVLERLASAEALLKAQGDLRDRVLVVETKAAAPLQPDAAVGLLEKRLTAMETTQAIPTAAEIMLADVKSRLTALETRPAPEPVVLSAKAVDLAPVEQRLTRVELGLEMKVAEITPVLSALADHTKDIGAIRERLAVAETRAGVPGPQGENGKDGVNGLNGTLENIKVMRRSERSIEFCFKDGTPIEGGLLKMNYPVFDDDFAYVKGKDYDLNTIVQWGGSGWVSVKDKPSGVPGQGSPEQTGWKLFIKRGTDGKDGKDAAGALPVVAVGSRS